MTDAQLLRDALHRADTTGPTPGWWHRAGCHNQPLALFFPPPNAGNAADAAAVCHTCPVRLDCLTDGITTERAGLQAGVRAGIGRNRIRDTARGGSGYINRATAGKAARIAALTDHGYTAQQIAAQLGLNERTVQRWRRRASTDPGKAA